MEFGVAVFLRPQIERDRGEFVDQGVGEAVLSEIDGLDVGVAGIAAVDPHVGELVSGVNRQFGSILLTASRTDDAAKPPFAQTETADKTAARAIALWAQDAEGGLAIAERAERAGVAVEFERKATAHEFCARLKKSEGEEFLGSSGRFVGGSPAGVQQFNP